MSGLKCYKGVTFALQAGGTCWFHSAISGFLLTPRGRRLLNSAYNVYRKKNKGLFPKYSYLHACPRRGSINLDAFWTYILFRLGKINVPDNEINNMEFQAIRNYRKLKRVNGGKDLDVIRICQLVFGNIRLPYNRQNMGNINNNLANRTKINNNSPVYVDFTLEPQYVNNMFIPDQNNNSKDYILNHVYIDVVSSNNNIPGHAITGFKCSVKNQNNNNYETVYYIYDSNTLKPKKLDWRNHERVLRYFRRNYESIINPQVGYLGVYIKKKI